MKMYTSKSGGQACTYTSPHESNIWVGTKASQQQSITHAYVCGVQLPATEQILRTWHSEVSPAPCPSTLIQHIILLGCMLPDGPTICLPMLIISRIMFWLWHWGLKVTLKIYRGYLMWKPWCAHFAVTCPSNLACIGGVVHATYYILTKRAQANTILIRISGMAWHSAKA